MATLITVLKTGPQGTTGATGATGSTGATGAAGVDGAGVPTGWYDPRDYGAVLDGVTDDITALEAMHLDIGPEGGRVHISGIAYISRTWVVSKSIMISGVGGGSEGLLSGIRVAPGRTAIQLDGAGLSVVGGNGAGFSDIGHMNISSLVLCHPSAHGGNGYFRIYQPAAFYGEATYRLGDVVVRAAGASPTRCYRATTVTGGALPGRSPTVLSGATQPSFSDTIGSTVTADGITWTTESLPRLRADSTAVVLGERMLGWNDNRYIFECTTAGTTAASTPSALNNGTDGNDPPGLDIGGPITDGTVVWTVRHATGVYVAANQTKIHDVFFTGFTGYGVTVQGGIGTDIRGNTDSNNTRLNHIRALLCGGGVYLAGDNCNGWTVGQLDTLHLGSIHPGLVIGSYADAPPWYNADGSRGGHGLFDHSLAGGLVVDMYAQLATGRPALKNGNGSRTMFLSCYEEAVVRALCITGQTTVIGGNFVNLDPLSSGHIILDQAWGEGIVETDRSGSVVLSAGITMQDGRGVFWLKAPEAVDPDRWSMRYADPYTGGKTGCWAMAHGSQVANSAYLLTTAKTGVSPGPGWLVFGKGFLSGEPDTGTFHGDIQSLRHNGLRNGRRIQGDTFSSGVRTIQITSNGYRGESQWAADPGFVNARISFLDWGLPATTVEPTTNDGTPGQKVFMCTSGTTFRTGVTEPNWATATIVNDTVVDNGVTWTLVGFTPTFATSMDRYDHDATTAATTANQVLGSVTLPAAATGKVDVYRVFASFVGGGNGGRVTGNVAGSFEVSAAGTITRLGTDDTSTPKGNGALSASTFNLNISSAILQFRGTPGSASSTRWKVLCQFELLSGVTA